MKNHYPVIIPARAGSKGIIDKNIIDFCGKPLIAWSIQQAKACELVSDIYVSTDGSRIAEVSEKYGAKVIWRPDELASDTASSEDALAHAIKVIEKSENVESIVFLQATSPVRRKEDILEAIKTFQKGNYDSLFSMTVLEDYCLWREENLGLTSITYDPHNRGRRQDRKPLYLENGSIYIFSKELFFKEKNRLGGRIGMYEMPMECSYEIDSMKDISICEFFMNRMIQEERENEESIL